MDLDPYKRPRSTMQDNPLHGQNYTRENFCPRCGERARHQVITPRGAWWQLRCISCGASFQVRSEGRTQKQR